MYHERLASLLVKRVEGEDALQPLEIRMLREDELMNGSESERPVKKLQSDQYVSNHFNMPQS